MADRKCCPAGNWPGDCSEVPRSAKRDFSTMRNEGGEWEKGRVGERGKESAVAEWPVIPDANSFYILHFAICILHYDLPLGQRLCWHDEKCKMQNGR